MDKLNLGLIGRKVVQVHDQTLVLDDNTTVFIERGEMRAEKDGTEFLVTDSDD